MSDLWSERAQLYRESAAHREGPDLDLLIEWVEEAGARTALDVARVSAGLVAVVDNLFMSDEAEEADRLRDPSHVRNYTVEQWRTMFEGAGLRVEDVRRFDKPIELEPWLHRTGCAGAVAERVRELLADRIEDGWVRLDRIALKGAKG